jgi:hypothetical protein
MSTSSKRLPRQGKLDNNFNTKQLELLQGTFSETTDSLQELFTITQLQSINDLLLDNQ